MVHIFPLADHFVCLDTKTDRVRIANQVAVKMLEYNEAGLNTEGIAAKIASEYDISLELARADTADLLETLHQGLEFNYRPVEEYNPDSSYIPERALRERARCHCYLPHFDITVRAESPGIVSLLGHYFQLPAQLSEASNSIQLDIYTENNQWPIVHNGVTLDTGLSMTDTVVKVMREVSIIAARHYEWVAVFHAASVARGTQGLLIPAIGGSGKTTLSAYLMAQGYSFLNDDTVALLESSERLMPVPIALSIKKGSWPLLGACFPQLASMDIFGYGDRQIKYLPPDQASVAADPVECSTILLPSYSPANTGAHIEPVATVDVCSKIIEGGCLMERPLSPAKLGEMIKWLNNARCFVIHYNALDQAYTEIEKLLDQLLLQDTME